MQSAVTAKSLGRFIPLYLHTTSPPFFEVILCKTIRNYTSIPDNPPFFLLLLANICSYFNAIITYKRRVVNTLFQLFFGLKPGINRVPIGTVFTRPVFDLYNTRTLRTKGTSRKPAHLPWTGGLCSVSRPDIGHGASRVA